MLYEGTRFLNLSPSTYSPQNAHIQDAVKRFMTLWRCEEDIAHFTVAKSERAPIYIWT